MARPWPGGIVFLALFFLLPVSSAGAAGTLSPGLLGADYDGDATANVVTITDAPMGMGVRVMFAEPGISADPGCTDLGDVAFCDIDSTDFVDVDGVGGDDRITVDGSLLIYNLSGGPGDDTITGSNATQGDFFALGDVITGGPGRDTLIGRGGNDSLGADEGDADMVDAGDGEDFIAVSDVDGVGDVLNGGPGFDTVFALDLGPEPDSPAVIDLAAGTASVEGASAALISIEDANGDSGPDILLGTTGPNILRGNGGDDVLDGRGGPDLLFGDGGSDRLEGRDGAFDQLMGSFGTDTCNADQLDVATGCEGGVLVQLPEVVTPPPPDRLAPACTISGVRARVKRRALMRRGLSASVTCDEGGRLRVRLVGVLRRPGRRARISAAGDLELAARTVTVVAAQPVRVRLRVARKLRRLVRRGVRLRLEVTAADAASNQATLTRRVRLR